MSFSKQHKLIEVVQNNRLFIRQYSRYILIGGLVGITTVALREAIAAYISVDTPKTYLFSILLVYALGIIVSFILHRTITFNIGTEDNRWYMFGRFIIVALIGAVSTSLLAVLLRYWLGFNLLFGRFGASIAFAAAACASSIITYWANAQFVFLKTSKVKKKMRFHRLFEFLKWFRKRQLKLFEKSSSVNILPPWVWLAFIILALIKLWLIGGQTLTAWGGNVHDDRLFINLANTLLKGEWLGSYNNLTLAKGAFYPFWIAVTFLLGIPLMLGQHLLYIAACVIFTVAVRPILPRPVMLLIIYTILLFNPVSYTDGPMTRVLREGIYPALTVLVAAGALGLLARQEHHSIKSLGLWATGLGVALSAFWLTREEGIWIIPLVLMIIGLAVVRLWQRRPSDWMRRLTLCALPFAIWLLAVTVVAGINMAHYGVFTTAETKSPGFLAAYGALTRVEPAQWRPDVPVSQETRLRIYSVSPAFAELRPFLEGDLGKGWSATSYFLNPTNQVWSANSNNSLSNEIGGGFFMWALRDAVAAAGYYSSGASASDYYRRLATEVNAACIEGKLDCGTRRASLAPPWHNKYTRPLLNALVNTGIYLAEFKGINPKPGPSVGMEDSLILFHNITGERLSPTKEQLQVKGWAFSPSSIVNLSVRTANGELADATIKYESSPDVYQYFLSTGQDIPNAREARFEITTNNNSGVYLVIKTGERLLGRLPLDGSTKSLQTPELQLIIDYIGGKSDLSHARSMFDDLRLHILGKIGALYQAIMPVLLIITLIAYTFLTIQVFGKRINIMAWIITTALLVAIITRILLISIINISSFWATNTSYLSPAYPLLLIFMSFVLIWVFDKNTLLDEKLDE